ncbi:hypothetical protein BD626DRAFT_72169 [Schizophyllum amplum]|uniref:Uncharacterized protein n=1 Tax=Schizophyllum amplum TaxID=97359 RepID=A0A550CAC9_9AGAR|nr:hypothetical protein BD626DRAFT_72169 [Auriculariopsis ampla]
MACREMVEADGDIGIDEGRGRSRPNLNGCDLPSRAASASCTTLRDASCGVRCAASPDRTAAVLSRPLACCTHLGSEEPQRRAFCAHEIFIKTRRDETELRSEIRAEAPDQLIELHRCLPRRRVARRSTTFRPTWFTCELRSASQAIMQLVVAAYDIRAHKTGV